MKIILVLFCGILLVSPWVIILWGAIEQFGFVGSLWFIPLGAIGGAVLLGFGGGWLYEFLIMLEDSPHRNQVPLEVFWAERSWNYSLSF